MEGPDEPIELESDLGRGLARLVSLVTLIAVLGLLGTLGWLFVIYPDSDGPEGHDEDVVVEVTEGMTLRPLALELEKRGVLKDARVWSVYMRMRGLDRHLRQGKIRFRIPMTPEQVARYATTRLGRIQIRILIPEGFSRFEIAERLEEYGICPAREFLEATEDSSLLASYGVEAHDAEGYLFPDTYEFDDRSKPRRVVERMLANWSRRYEEIQEEYADQLARLNGWTTHDIITLASVVEKEAALPSERARIAGVFWNRLTSRRFLPRRRLQADPDRPVWLHRRSRGCTFLQGLRWSNHARDARRSGEPLQHVPAFGAPARPDQQPREGRHRGRNRPREARLLLFRSARKRPPPFQQDPPATQHRRAPQQLAMTRSRRVKSPLFEPEEQQLGLFDRQEDERPDRAETQRAELESLRDRLPAKVRFGTSSWTFPGWAGLVYAKRYGNQKTFSAGIAR